MKLLLTFLILFFITYFVCAQNHFTKERSKEKTLMKKFIALVNRDRSYDQIQFNGFFDNDADLLFFRQHPPDPKYFNKYIDTGYSVCPLFFYKNGMVSMYSMSFMQEPELSFQIDKFSPYRKAGGNLWGVYEVLGDTIVAYFLFPNAIQGPLWQFHIMQYVGILKDKKTIVNWTRTFFKDHTNNNWDTAVLRFHEFTDAKKIDPDKAWIKKYRKKSNFE